MNDLLPTLFDDGSLAPKQAEQVIFDYRLLSSDKREFVLQKTDETQWLLKKTAENIIKIGQNLQEVQAQLPHGMFLPWLQSEFGMSRQSADNFVHVAQRFGDKLLKFSNLATSALYLLSAPKTPQSAIDEAIQLADNGKKVTHAMAQKLIEAEKAKEKAEAEKAEALAEAEIAQQKLFNVQEESESRITELSQQIEALQEEMMALTIPSTEYVDKEVWPEEKVKELQGLQKKIDTLTTEKDKELQALQDDLQGKIDKLNADVEEQKKAIPPEIQKDLDALRKQLDTLKGKHKQQEEANTYQQERIKKLTEELNAAIRDGVASENDERIRQEWRLNLSEGRSCLNRILGNWPTPLDKRSFEADDWALLDHFKQTLRRVLEESDNLSYNGDEMIVDDHMSTSPIRYVEGGSHAH